MIMQLITGSRVDHSLGKETSKASGEELREAEGVWGQEGQISAKNNTSDRHYFGGLQNHCSW